MEGEHFDKQNIVAFHSDQGHWLENLYNRQRALDEAIDAQAQLMYRCRCLWIGGQCLPWGMLSSGQRNGYRDEIRDLVTKVKGEQ